MTKIYFFTVQKARSPRLWCQYNWVLVRACWWQLPLIVPHMLEREYACSLAPLTRILILLDQNPTLLLSLISRFYSSLKSLSPVQSPEGLGLSSI